MNIASQPYQRGIYCQDESISYPLRPDTISHVTMAVVTITCTIIIVSPSFIDISIIPSMISSSHESRADSQQSVRSWLCTAERFIMHNNTALCARGRVWHIYNTPNCFNLCRYRNAYFFCSFRYLQVKHTWCTAKRFTPTLPLNQYVSAIYKVLGAFLFGGAVSQSLTDLAKYTIGRPRPHFLTVCAPKVCKGYVASINCTGDPRVVTEARYVSQRKCCNVFFSVNCF